MHNMDTDPGEQVFRVVVVFFLLFFYNGQSILKTELSFPERLTQFTKTNILLSKLHELLSKSSFCTKGQTHIPITTVLFNQLHTVVLSMKHFHLWFCHHSSACREKCVQKHKHCLNKTSYFSSQHQINQSISQVHSTLYIMVVGIKRAFYSELRKEGGKICRKEWGGGWRELYKKL